jgi:hypothetical protein
MVCYPPHVIVSEARTFFVYSDQFIVVPPNQIGIARTTADHRLLKALGIYLYSDFVTYHQFLIAPQAGTQKSISTLRALRLLPIPFESSPELDKWESFYSRVDNETKKREDFNRLDLISELNELTYESLRLGARSRAAIEDLVRVRLSLLRGKVREEAIGLPSSSELETYCTTLRDELDGFLGEKPSARHVVQVVFDARSGMVSVDLAQRAGSPPLQVHVWKANAAEAQEMARTRQHLLQQRSQWLYFNRNLRIYEGSKTFILKPLQRLHWTRTQAIQDAGQIVAETLQPQAQQLETILE